MWAYNNKDKDIRKSNTKSLKWIQNDQKDQNNQTIWQLRLMKLFVNLKKSRILKGDLNTYNES